MYDIPPAIQQYVSILNVCFDLVQLSFQTTEGDTRRMYIKEMFISQNVYAFTKNKQYQLSFFRTLCTVSLFFFYNAHLFLL
jgi:hypothetical protein